MRCPNRVCNAEIPPNQALCPACYTSTRELPEKDNRNVMHFLSDDGLNGLFSGRVEKYLQPRLIKGNWFADTDTAFDEITRNPAGQWHVLIMDTVRATDSAAAIEKFRTIHPTCTVAVLRKGNATSSPLKDSIFLHHPGDIDEWLLMMHTLLRQS
jgi:hypothetical protein